MIHTSLPFDSVGMSDMLFDLKLTAIFVVVIFLTISVSQPHFLTAQEQGAKKFPLSRAVDTKQT